MDKQATHSMHSRTDKGRQFISEHQLQTKMADMDDESSRQSANPSDDQYTSNVNLNDESDYMGDNVSRINL